MNELIGFLKFRNYSKLKFTFQVFIIITTITVTLLLVNFLYNKIIYLPKLDFFEFLQKIIIRDSGLHIWLPDSILVVLFGVYVLWILTVILPLFYFCIQTLASWSPFSKEVTFITRENLNNLTYMGKVHEFGTKGFRITNSEGVLLKHLYCRNFIATINFDFQGLKPAYEPVIIKKKIDNVLTDALQTEVVNSEDNYVGFLFRALDLNNYFMLSIGIKQKVKIIKNKREYRKKLLITPHIRVDGQWQIFPADEFPKEDFAVQEIVKEKGRNEIVFKVKSNTVVVDINGEYEIYKWNLPTNFIKNYGDSDSEKSIESRKYAFGDTSIIPFRNLFTGNLLIFLASKMVKLVYLYNSNHDIK
ncbi:hypothetical protein HY612_00850 [Candidatus Roizmanbacteria bacterium]|nr:hypothetical protein [Candidatus Roizmanbacteria bacterium]